MEASSFSTKNSKHRKQNSHKKNPENSLVKNKSLCLINYSAIFSLILIDLSNTSHPSVVFYHFGFFTKLITDIDITMKYIGILFEQ